MTLVEVAEVQTTATDVAVVLLLGALIVVAAIVGAAWIASEVEGWDEEDEL